MLIPIIPIVTVINLFMPITLSQSKFLLGTKFGKIVLYKVSVIHASDIVTIIRDTDKILLVSLSSFEDLWK